MFLCNDMNRDLVLTLPRKVRAKKETGAQDGKEGLAISADNRIRVKPGVKNQVKIDDEVWDQLSKGNKVFKAYLDTNRIRVSKKEIENAAPLTDKSGDATPPDELEDTRNAKNAVDGSKNAVKHDSKGVEAVEVEVTTDDAPSGGKKK